MVQLLEISLDRESPVPLYHQLSRQLIAGVEQGVLKPGEPFENELAMADRLRLSRPTVRRAIGELVNRGLLVRRRGIGTVVAQRAVHRRGELTSLFDDMHADQLRPRTAVLLLDRGVLAPVAADALDLPTDTTFLRLERVRLVDELPLAVMRNWLPESLPGLDRLTAEQLEAEGLYSLLRQGGIRPTVARQRFAARQATTAERDLLGLGRHDPVLTMARRAHSCDGLAVEYGEHTYRGDQYSVELAVFDV